MNIVCLVLDRLHWGYLGCYGNTWVATPAFDHLAAEGFVFAQALAESTDLAETYHSLWGGAHLLERAAATSARRTPLPELARGAGLRTLLITDEPAVAEHELGAAFDETAELEPAADDATPPAAAVEATHTAKVFAAAIERLTADSGPTFLWLHARALGGPWDAPTEFRNKFAEEDDPTPPDFTAVPKRELASSADLDERFGIAQAYAGQISLVDLCVGGLLEHLEEVGKLDDTAVVLLSPRGVALGEHGFVGPFDDRLHGELVQIPLIVRLPAGRGKLRRSQALVQPSDLYHALADLVGEQALGARRQALGEAEESNASWARSLLPLIDDPTTVWRDRSLVVAAPPATEFGFRTAAWFLRACATPADAAADEPELRDELYVKPDDAWEATDVADRAGDVVELLRAASADLRGALAEGKMPAPLAEELGPGRG